MTAKKYRKKPVVIEAVQITDETTADDIADFINCPEGSTYSVWSSHVDIHTLKGTMRADIGDFIIKGVAGAIYPCKPDIFEETYEAGGGMSHNYETGYCDEGRGIEYVCMSCDEPYWIDCHDHLEALHDFAGIDLCYGCLGHLYFPEQMAALVA